MKVFQEAPVIEIPSNSFKGIKLIRSLCNRDCFTICEARCTEKCDTGKLCIENHDLYCTCSHPKGHSIMIPHECYACDALRESNEKVHRKNNTTMRETIKRKAGPIVNPRGAQHCKHVANVEPITTDMSTARPSDNAHFGDANEHS